MSAAAVALDTALSRSDLPLVFRCVHAPTQDVAALEALTSWDEARAATPPVVVYRSQRERLRRAVTRRGVESAVRSASGLDAFRYDAPAASVDVDPRAWLESLPRDPGARVLTSDLYSAYVDSLPTGSRPLHNRAFHALAVEILGAGDPTACRRRIRGRDFYLAVSLNDGESNPDEPPGLRLVTPA